MDTISRTKSAVKECNLAVNELFAAIFACEDALKKGWFEMKQSALRVTEMYESGLKQDIQKRKKNRIVNR